MFATISTLFCFFVLVVLYPNNPCPNVFQYVQDANNIVFGKIVVPYDGITKTLLLSVNASLKGYYRREKKLKLELVTPIYYIMGNNHLHYEVVFPFQNNLPKITQIVFNGNIFCSGRPYQPYFTGTPVTDVWSASQYRLQEVTTGKLFVIPPCDITDSQICDGHRDCFLGVDEAYCESDLPLRVSTSKPFSNVCGRPMITNFLMVNGLDIPRGAYPWLAAIFMTSNTGLTYSCAGSLISNKHVVTAAHCVLNDGLKLKPQDLFIILGKLNIAKWVPSSDDMTIEPKEIHVHPDYTSPNRRDADIAVIELSDVVTFTAVISPICLWEGSDSLSSVVGENGIVVGWGNNEEGLHTLTAPKQTYMPIVSQKTCLESNNKFQYITTNRTLCAGSRNNSGPCNGDSGAGLILKKNGLWMLRGLVSLSISDEHTKSCDLTNYVVFTDVSKFRTWLKSFIP